VERSRAEDLIARLNRDGSALAARFGLAYRVIEAELPRVRRRYGVCYADGTIRIRLRHAATGKPLKYSSLVNTLCHELAHLKHFNHGLRFQRFYRQILEYARAVRIYCPGPPDAATGGPPPSRPPPAPPLRAATPRAAARTPQRPTPRRPPAAGPVQLPLF
jgi:hypothetical protein